MRNIVIFGLSILVFLFSGCSFSQKPTVNTVNMSNQTENHSIKKAPKSGVVIYNSNNSKKSYTKVAKKKIYSGSIKGIITNLSYNRTNKEWLYEIKGKDISNNKLPYAKFYHYKKLANIGDFVYVILKKSALVELYFIKKVNKKISKRVKAKIKKKRTKEIIKGGRILKIEAPVEESIVF